MPHCVIHNGLSHVAGWRPNSLDSLEFLNFIAEIPGKTSGVQRAGRLGAPLRLPGCPCAKRGLSPRERQCLHATFGHDPAAHRLQLGSHSAVGDAADVAVLRYDKGEEGLSRFRSFQDKKCCAFPGVAQASQKRYWHARTAEVCRFCENMCKPFWMDVETFCNVTSY